MSTNHEHTNHEQNGEDELHAARRTAYALGQTEGAERKSVEAEISASPRAKEDAAEVQQLAARLKEAAHAAARVEPSVELRTTVERRLAAIEASTAAASPATVRRTAIRSWWRRRMAALAFAAACLVIFAVPLAQSLKLIAPSRPREVAQAMPNKQVAPLTKEQIQQRLVELVDKFNRLNEEGRYKEAYIVANQARELLPNEGVTRIMSEESALVLRVGPEEAARIRRENYAPLAMSVDRPFGHDAIVEGRLTLPSPYYFQDDTQYFPPSTTGTLTLGSNTYTGGTTISGGALNIGGYPPTAPNSGVTIFGNREIAQDGDENGDRKSGGGRGDVQPFDNAANPSGYSPWMGLYTTPQAQSAAGGAYQGQSTTITTYSRSEIVRQADGGFNYTPGADSGKQPTMSYAGTPGMEAQAGGGLVNPNSYINLAGTFVPSAAASSGSAALGYQISNTGYASEPKPATPQKPVQSWKPARAVPNASRLMVGEKEELPLKGMQVDVRVDGFRARVLLDLYYFNDRPQQLEGNFQLRLPQEAAPYFFAFGRTIYQAPQVTPADSMFFKAEQVSLGDTTPEKILALRGNSWEQPKVARMVPKEKAASAYRDTVRRRIDPALVEWSGAGIFQCRVFPLAPQSLHRITIGYDVDLVRVGDDLELRLDLPEQTPATVVDLNVSAADARQVSLDAPATQTGDGRLAYRLVDPQQRPLMLRLRKPGTLMLVGNDEATGNYFATRVTLPPEALTPGPSPILLSTAGGRGEKVAGPSPLAAKGTVPFSLGRKSGQSPDRPERAIFLVDASLSAGPQFPLWTKMLRATLENNRDQIKQFAVLFFNVETFWWQEKYVDNTPENVAAVLNYADNLALEGATDLGRALQEAGAPKWQIAGGEPPPDLFLLSDGAATWGEDRWGLLAANVCSPGFSRNPGSQPPKGGTTNSTQPPKGGTTSALFAYHTALAGGDSRLLGYLAQRTGGALFSLVGEAEIARASVAHRNRPWKLTNIELAGSHDVLIAGRPQYVYPGQQLTIVGRMETGFGGARKLDPPYITFTLQQGKVTQTIKVAMDQVLSSELAGRTFGQVATNQLEEVSGIDQTAEPVATAYARHFRVTGKTCSLLMLESEQDYAHFNIKPEEDSFVVHERPADPIVSKAIADTVAAMSDPKASFLAWYRRLSESSEMHFDLPASLKVFIEGLPAETFAVTPQPLVCKLRMQHELPANFQQPWRTGMADYETLDAEAQRRLAAYGPDDALRCLSSLIEERPGDPGLARDVAFTAIDWQRPGEAYHLLRRAANARTFEPITFHAMAHCLEQMGRTDLAIVYYELACGGQWDARFGDMHNIALLDYARFLRRVVASKGSEGGKGDSPIFAGAKIGTVPAYAESRLASLTAMNLRDTADVAALIFWNTDGTDVDLHVIEPSGEECYYQHTQTASGGHISRDVTTGYGPELYLLPKAPAGKYAISAHYFATDANRASTRTKVLAFIYENWGTPDEHLAIKSLALTGQKERHELGTVKR